MLGGPHRNFNIPLVKVSVEVKVRSAIPPETEPNGLEKRRPWGAQIPMRSKKHPPTDDTASKNNSRTPL